MRIVIDYRPALRARTGVGEYIHQLAAALARAGHDDITVFSSSWKDRAPAGLATEIPNATIVDWRIPVSALNLAWHRFQWPPVEVLAGGPYDVAHSPHPLLLPSSSAAQVVTIHDLHFLSHPERTSREVRRDYPTLASSHARRADRIVVSSMFAAGEVHRALNIEHEKIAVCPAGAPEWKTPPATAGGGDYILFMGTLDARKNVGGLLEAYGRFLSRTKRAPRLLLAGGAGPDAAKWLAAIARPPLAGQVEYLGYVPSAQREALFKRALLFVLPSFEEGFGLPALEAMSAGIPVIASNRGALPEVIGEAGLLVNPEDAEGLAVAISKLAGDAVLRATCAERGLARARRFTWEQTAREVRRAYEDALAARRYPADSPGVRSPKPQVQSPGSRVESPESRVQSPTSTAPDAYRD